VIYDLNNLVSFNSRLEDYFVTNTTKQLNAIYERFLTTNINKLKKKDKTLLKEIPKLHTNYELINNLNFLWNEGFNTNNFNNNDLIFFTKQTKENIGKNKKLTKTLKVEDIKIAKNIRKRDIEEKRKTLAVTNSSIITSDFGNIYLQERNKEVAKNFNKVYQEKIFSSIDTYFKDRLSIAREKNLIHHLSFNKLSDLTNEGRNDYNDDYNRAADLYGLKRSSNATYDSLKFSPKERIRRIAKTELSAAYNLARYKELVDQGFVEFQIKNNNSRNECVLCVSKINEIITLNQIENLDKGFTDFRGIDTRKDKNAYENRNLIFPIFHPNCGCYLIGKSKEEKEDKKEKNKNKALNKLKQVGRIANKISTANTVFRFVSGLANTYIGLQQEKKQQQDDALLKVIIAGGSIMSISMMYYYFTKTNPITKVITTTKEKIAGKTSDLVLGNPLRGAISTAETLQEKLQLAVVNKNLTQAALYETGYKSSTSKTLSQLLLAEQKQVINNQLSSSIKNNFTEKYIASKLQELTLDPKGIQNLSNLATSSIEEAQLEKLEVLLNGLMVNNKTINKKELINLIYKEKALVKAVRIPLNIKEPELLLIQNTENKALGVSTKLARLGTNLTKLNKEVKQNKGNYLKDVELLRELDSKLTEELIGLERVNDEYRQLIDVSTNTNLSKYLNNKVNENQSKADNLRNKLNDIGTDLYGTKLDQIDPSIKDQLITNIRSKGKQYLEFNNNRKSEIASINKKLSNYIKGTTKDKLSIDYIDIELEKLDKLDVSYTAINKNSLVLDNMLSDYAILNKIDKSNPDLGYTFNTYLNTSSKRVSQIQNVDKFRETSLTATKVNLDNYKKKLLTAKYRLLNNETVEFKAKTSYKKLCHIKLKNILERVRREE